jgi:chemotaxis protein methyltransferase CheR
MLFFTPDILMSDEEFRLLRDLIYQHCGLHFTVDSKYLLEKRLSKRLHLHRLKNFKDYYYLLRYGQQRDLEMAEVVDALTTNETYFFREDFQLRTLVQDILPELCARKAKAGDCRLRIWSAGCSTGEEPYTIAMLLLEQPMLQDWSIDIIGTDISQRVLQVARKGVYGLPSFRSTDAAYLQRYFSKTEAEGKYRICDDVKKLVTISHLNLFDTPRVALLGKMDIVLCRNVIIYFDHAAKKKVIDSFFQRLRPEGFLLLGHSESLMNLSTDFLLRHFTHDMVYQRPVLPPGMEPIA